MHQLLHRIANPNTPHQSRRAAERELEQRLEREPEQLTRELTNLATRAGEEQIHALVLLRTLLLKPNNPIWKNNTLKNHSEVLSQLFQSLLTTDLSTELTNQLGHTIADLTKNCPEETFQTSDQWIQNLRPILLSNLLANEHQNPIRQTALLNIFIALPWLFSSEPHQLESIVLTSLNSNHFPLRLAALQTICVPALDIERSFTDPVHRSILLPLLSHPQQSELETALTYLIEFVTFNEIPDLPIWIDPLLQLTLNRSASHSIRTTSLECLITLIESRAITPELPSLDWLQAVFHGLLSLMAEIDDDPHWSSSLDDEADDDLDAIYVQAEQALDRLTQEVAKSHSDQLFELILQVIQQQPPPPAWQPRHALLSAIAVTGDGLQQSYSLATQQIYHLLNSGFEDPHPRVIYAAIYAIAQLSSPLKTVFSTQPFHQKVLTWLVRCLEKNTEPRIQAYAAKALINVLWDEGSSKKNEIPDEMIGPILGRLVMLCESGYNDRKTLSNKIRLDALNAIKMLFGSMSRQGALAFYDDTNSTLRNLIHQVELARKESTGDGEELMDEDIDETELRVFEVIGRLAMASGHQKFDADATWWANQMMTALELRPKGQTRILNSLARVSIGINPDRLVSEGFLAAILDRLLTICTSKPDISVSALLDNCHEFDDRQWESVVIGEQTFGIKSAELADKEIAVKTLILLAQHVGAWLIPHCDQIVEAVVPLLKFYFSDEVRESAMTLLPLLLQSAKASGMASEQLRTISTSFCNSITHALSVEPLDPCNLADSLLVAWAECVGCEAPSQEEVFGMAAACCERIERMESDNSLHGEDEHEDEQYADDLRRLFTAISRALRLAIGLQPAWMSTKFHHLLLKWVPIRHSIQTPSPLNLGLKRLAFRLLAAFVLHSPPAGFAHDLLSILGQHVLDGLHNEDECVRGLAPFIIGLCAQKNGESTASIVYLELIKSSIDVLVSGMKRTSASSLVAAAATSPEAVQVTRENCISALAKIIRNSEGVVMDVERILPQWIDALPIEIDVEEIEPSYGLLLELIARGHESVDPTKNELGRVEQVIRALVAAVGNEATPVECRASLSVGLRAYLAHLPADILAYKDDLIARYRAGSLPDPANSVWVSLDLLAAHR